MLFNIHIVINKYICHSRNPVPNAFGIRESGILLQKQKDSGRNDRQQEHVISKDLNALHRMIFRRRT